MKEDFINWIFIIVTAIIAWHGLTYRNKEGEKDFVRLLFGCISLLFFLRVLFIDIIKII
tara:strand:+ start:6047 stop:6223 length:177 start_codon:yes stop_codon:yes gene_type:complete